ncbi:Putative amidase domain-containing protein [Oceanobacillus limi]|uniref:Putative amidase domain-containing protein n=1 Tax=Oceanobacillus limi TaxID=930131 RepID=A0A1H9YG35_9BACI|nr:amidase domain-containing protein [Oceanobacillus limi]SES67945.1 Putative amidase domain-containing protein [Oceanobacillus limi]
MDELKSLWIHVFESDRDTDNNWWKRKKELCDRRGVEIVRINGNGHIYQRLQHREGETINYLLHLTFLMKQEDHFYLEESVNSYQFRFVHGEVRDHHSIPAPVNNLSKEKIEPEAVRNGQIERFHYDRMAAVQYAERWWNSYNPDYRKFEVDCTNFVSQCLRAGGAPMSGAPNRNKGWWYQGNNWSYSWSVAHSLRWYLNGSTSGLKGTAVASASELSPGDIICYDFEGDGRWDHNTIVVSRDNNGEPLVNAHTDNSRHRYWSYEDSTAYTPNINYKFFRIGE